MPYLYDSDNVNREQGHIYKSDSKGPQYVGSWARAVAGIAFGGLVPMVTKPLIDAVKFTVGGGIEQADLDTLEDLISLVLKRTKEEVGDAPLRLFGVYREIYNDMARSRDKIDFSICLSNQENILEIVEALIRYNTLLERLIAMIPRNEEAERTAIEEPRLTEVFSTFCTKLCECYKTACAEEKKRQGKGKEKGEDEEKGAENGTGTKTEDSTIKNLLARAQCQKWQPTHYDCAVVAWYVIKAWTCVTKIVDWSEARSLPSKFPDFAYKPVPFASLPDVALWE
jgi:hypothetical protein